MAASYLLIVYAALSRAQAETMGTGFGFPVEPYGESCHRWIPFFHRKNDPDADQFDGMTVDWLRQEANSHWLQTRYSREPSALRGIIPFREFAELPENMSDVPRDSRYEFREIDLVVVDICGMKSDWFANRYRWLVAHDNELIYPCYRQHPSFDTIQALLEQWVLKNPVMPKSNVLPTRGSELKEILVSHLYTASRYRSQKPIDLRLLNKYPPEGTPRA